MTHSSPKPIALIRVFCFVLFLLWWNTMSKKQVVGGRVYCWNYTFIIEGSQDRAESWRQELMQRPWRMLLTGLLCRACSACFLIEPRTTSLGMAPRPSYPWSLIEKMHYSWISWRHFLKGGSFFCDNSSLCQVDTQNQPVQYPTQLKALPSTRVREDFICKGQRKTEAAVTTETEEIWAQSLPPGTSA